MRRKSERTVKNSPIKRTTENVSRRTSRRNQKTPENTITEEESENSSDQASSSENEAEEVVAPKRRSARSIEKSSSAEEIKEKATPSRQKRKTALKRDVETIEEEQTIADDATTADDIVQPEKNENDEKIESTEPEVNNDDDSMEQQANQAVVEPSNNQNDKKEAVEQEAVVETTSNSEANDNVVVETTDISTGNDAAVEVSDEPTEKTEKPKQSPVKEKQQRRTLRRLDKEISCQSDENVTPNVENITTTTNTPIEINSSEIVASDEKIDSDIVTIKEADDAKVVDSKSESQPNDSHENSNDNSIAVDTTTAKDIPSSENDSSAKVVKKKPLVRKRKWLSNKTSAPKIQEIAISSDSLKGLISDVNLVPLSDIKLDSSPEIDHESDDVKVVSSTSLDYNRQSEEHQFDLTEEPLAISTTRKISIVHEPEEAQPPSPAKHSPCNILYITNLVRPFTVLQLKGLLLRTGKIVENGFWMDKIKSKCFVKYETEE